MRCFKLSLFKNEKKEGRDFISTGVASRLITCSDGMGDILRLLR